MRSQSFWLLFLGLLLVSHTVFVAAEADDDDDDDVEDNAQESPSAPPAAPVEAEEEEDNGPLPDYKAPEPTGPVEFLETFDENWQKRWSVIAKDPFTGKWERSVGELGKGLPGDHGVQMKTAGARHALAAKFGKTLDNKDKPLVIQYEIRAEKQWGCDGGYIKVLSSEKPFEAATFNAETPYTIMFGPDRCGMTDKVHFILRHKNPVSGVFEEKHFKDTPKAINDKRTHVYTLVIRPDNTFEILIDDALVKKGNLLESMEPPVNPAKMIDDPEDKKPEDWVDEEMIDDPDATKPDDWDEDAPQYIPDEDAVKPADWMDDEPLQVADPSASQPDDWDSEEDGEWEAPQVPNPKCEKAGCGEWKRPMKKNPDYKGKWKVPRIKNPKYIGVWKAKQIENPHYFVDEHPHNVQPMVGVGIELLSNSGDMLFDNILITFDEKVAADYRKATWSKRHERELTTIKDSAPNPNKKPEVGMFDWVGDMLENNPVPLFVGFLSLIGMFGLIIWRCLAGDDNEKAPVPAARAKKTDAPSADDAPADGGDAGDADADTSVASDDAKPRKRAGKKTKKDT